MIKIELKNHKEILKFHYDNLTNKKGKEQLIVDGLEIRVKRANKNMDLKKTYEHLIEKVIEDKNGFSILTATPIELEKFKIDFEKKYIKNLTDDLRKDLRKDLLKVFYYNKYDKWQAYELAKKINVNVCPYCNRNYTFTLGNDSKKGTRFEYDHFFDKARYPYLALSFYNLVPSCHICNSSLKGSKKFNLKKNIHPYLEGFGKDYTFSISPKNINFIKGDPFAYDVKFVKTKESKWDDTKINQAKKNIEVFRLEELYNLHKDYINEIIQKSIVYNDDYIKNLFEKYKGTLFSSEEDVKRMVLGNYTNEADYNKRPLSKLTADISKELGILK
jgi:hypothetical protein